MEVLVVDGMSTDGTREKVAGWCAQRPELRMLDNPRRIVPTAMNIGIRAARGRWIARLDAHTEYAADYLTRCLETIARTAADNVGGCITTLTSDDTLQGRLVRALTTHRFGVGNAGFRVGAREGKADTVVFGCFRREIFERVGMYDERLVRNQDYELNRRIIKAGGTIWHNPAIGARYFNQPSIIGLLRQAFGTGQWNVWMWYLAPYSFAWRHAIPLMFVIGLLGALLLLLASSNIGLAALVALLAPYFALAVYSSVQQARRYGIWMAPILPFMFFAYHASYGAGSLWGILMLAMRKSPVQSSAEPWAGEGLQRSLTRTSE
jgi:glycosyltransferase involved in cell wall biosynthesis